ncbi:MAG: pseudouridine synthase [Crocinitomicaceae bacterium]
MSDHYHFKIHKPFGVISQFIHKGKRRKEVLSQFHDFPEGTMAIGRLDEQSEGLLLLTTDGQTSENVRRKTVEKEYYVQVDGTPDEFALLQLQNGVEIGIKGEKYKTLPCFAKAIEDPVNFPPRIKKIRDDRHGPTSWLSITITEGKYRQVRKMTAAVGHATLRLVRVRIGDITLGNMKAGAVEAFDPEKV